MKRYRWLILGIGSLVVIVVLVLLFQNKDSDKPRPHDRLTRRTEKAPSAPTVSLPPTPTTASAPPPVERGKGVAVVASSRMVEQRAVEFSNLVNAIWSAGLGTIFAPGDGGPASVKVTAGMEVNALEQALSRCAMSLLLWDEDVNQNTIKALKDYCETGGWLLFVSCPWIGGSPKSSPAELLALRDFRGIMELARYVNDTLERRAIALLRHPCLPDLPVGERLRVWTPRKVLSGGEGKAIPLVRFEDPAVRGVTIRALGHGGIVDANWDCVASGGIGEIDSKEMIKVVLAWLAAKESWIEPREQPGISLKVIAMTPAGDPAPGAQIAVKVHTDWAKPLDQQIVTVRENGEGEIPAKAPAIYTAWASGEGYSSDTVALGRAEEGTGPDPLVVTVRPSLRIVGTLVYTGEKAGPASGVEVDLLPSSRARGMDIVSTKTDDEGRFVFNQVPGGRPYLLRSETEEWAALEEIDLPESTRNGTFEVTLSLEKLAAIDGRVVEEGNEQKPIEGATVRFEPRWGIKALPLFSHLFMGQSTSTGTEGEFRLPVLPDVTYRLRAAAPGYVWRELESNGIERTAEGWVEVTPPATVTLELGRGTTVKGIVYFPGGQPAPGTNVTVSSWPASIQAQNADLEGRFCFSCILLQPHHDESAKLKRVAVRATSGDYDGGEVLWVPIEQKEVEVAVTMERYSFIDVRGVVTDIEGQPVPDAMVNHSGDSKTDVLAQTDQNGYFQAAMRRENWLRVWKKGYRPVDVEWEKIDAAVKDRSLLRVVLPREDGWIAGRVVLDDDTPLCSETVELSAGHRTIRGYTLGERGEFRLEGIPVEGTRGDVFEAPVKEVSLYVYWHPDPKSRDIVVAANKDGVRVGDSDVVVRFGPFSDVRGKLVNGENGAGMVDAPVMLFREGVSRKSNSDASGEFRFDWLVPGEHELGAWAPGFWMCVGSIEIRPGHCNVGEIFLHKTILVQGQAIDEETRMPVNGAEVRLETGPENCVREVTDSTGRFRMSIASPLGDTTIMDAASRTISLAIYFGDRHDYGGGCQVKPSQTNTAGVLDVGAINVRWRENP